MKRRPLMSWRSRVRGNLASGAYRQEDEGALASAFKGFAEVYVPLKAKEQAAKLDLQKDALAKAKAKEIEEASWKKSAVRLAAEMFPENPTSSAAITYAYSTIASYEGNVGQATERLENLVSDERLEIVGASAMKPSTDVASLMGNFESGSGGYNALLNQSQNSEFSDFNLTEMNMGEVLDFSAPGSEYFNWSKQNMPTGTKAAASGNASTPMGKYQFVGSTLNDIKQRGGFTALGINDETVFDEKTQDSLFAWYASDRLAAAGDSESAKRNALRGVWEGFKPENVSDAELDKVITEIETGTFTEASIKTKPKTKKFDLGSKLADLTYDEDGLAKWKLLNAEIGSEAYDLTSNQTEMFNMVGAQIKAQIKDGGMFDFADFLEENRLNSAGDAMGAMTVVGNMEVSMFRGGEREKNEAYIELKRRLDMFDEREREDMLAKASANGDPLVFYPREEDGRISLDPVMVQVQPDNTLKQIGTNTIIDPTSGKLTTEQYDASDFIKTYNKPIMDASRIVESGVAGITNLLEYRKLTQDNPQAYNTYLTWFQGVGDNVENLGSTFKTLVAGGATYEQVELEIFSSLRDLTGPAKDIFARQLQAAYDLARLNESKGQGLSDRELTQNLQAVGFGEPRAEGALRKINIAVDRYMLGTEARRAGIVNGLMGDKDYRKSIENTRFGMNFNDLASQEMQGNEILNKQLQLAQSGDFSLSAETSNVSTEFIPPFEEFKARIIKANEDYINTKRETDPNFTLSDQELMELYTTTFPNAVVEGN